MSRRIGIVLVILLATASGVMGEPTFVIEEGEIEGVPFALAVPEPWNGIVLLIAHGWRPAEAPLMAVLDPADPVIAARLAEGWLVAATGYRRNGWILEEAAEDLTRLLGYVADTRGAPRRVILEGSSLGGGIGLHLAEQEVPVIDGLLAQGAYPSAEGPDGPVAWTYHLRVPVLFLSNIDEYEPVEDYAARVGGEAVRPALWVVERAGHVNFNGPERLAAHAALDRWLEDRVRAPGWVGRPHDATVLFEPPPSRAVVGPGSREGRVVNVDPVYGNLGTDLVAADLHALGIEPGDYFTVSCVAGPRRIMWGTAYADVEQGKLVAFITADGFLEVAVNMGDAASRLDGRVGDAIFIEPIPKEKGHDPRQGNRPEDGRVQRDPRHH